MRAWSVHGVFSRRRAALHLLFALGAAAEWRWPSERAQGQGEPGAACLPTTRYCRLEAAKAGSTSRAEARLCSLPLYLLHEFQLGGGDDQCRQPRCPLAPWAPLPSCRRPPLERRRSGRRRAPGAAAAAEAPQAARPRTRQQPGTHDAPRATAQAQAAGRLSSRADAPARPSLAAQVGQAWHLQRLHQLQKWRQKEKGGSKAGQGKAKYRCDYVDWKRLLLATQA